MQVICRISKLLIANFVGLEKEAKRLNGRLLWSFNISSLARALLGGFGITDYASNNGEPNFLQSRLCSSALFVPLPGSLGSTLLSLHA